MNVLDALVKGKALIDAPEKWTQEFFARKADGETCFSDNPEAVCWCSMGALNNVCRGGQDTAGYRAEDLLNEASRIINGGDTNIISYNDCHTHAEVMQVWDKAIELAQAEDTRHAV